MLKEFALLLSFMTRVPVRVPREADDRMLGRSARLLPILGLLLGLSAAALLWLLNDTGKSLAAACGVAFMLAVTGAQHLNGLMKLADGLSGNRERREAFVIMKSKHIGAMGVLSAVLLLILKFAAYYTLLSTWSFWRVLPAALLFSRFMMAFCIWFFPAARTNGLGASLHNNFKKGHFIFACVSAGLALALVSFSEPLICLAALPAFFAVFAPAKVWEKRLGGLNGECYGAAAEWGETFFLLSWFVVFYANNIFR
ncbi:MAG: adenosylcobinamide-GDP ribazoletransferase [Clostridiales bacterium]|nr:adenosylcobinamide-GDP ribazoletransferase [Clostridiales bacterium]